MSPFRGSQLELCHLANQNLTGIQTYYCTLLDNFFKTSLLQAGHELPQTEAINDFSFLLFKDNIHLVKKNT